MDVRLISDRYLALNKDLHSQGRYGAWGNMWVEPARELIERYRPRTILDYGCGQGTLARELGLAEIAEYDPAIEGKDALPAPADLVLCTDVLEHIEPECLDRVLDHLRSLTKVALFAVISTRPAKKVLSDGRNAHLIVEPWSWWERKLSLRFDIVEMAVDPAEARVVLHPVSRFTSAVRRLLAST